MPFVSFILLSLALVSFPKLSSGLLCNPLALATVVTPTEYGPVRAVSIPTALFPGNCVFMYKFIKFAKPNPVSKFGSSVPPDPWAIPTPTEVIALETVDDITVNPPGCVQPLNDGTDLGLPYTVSEDCLYMSIGVSSFPPSSGLAKPVVVYFAGGNFRFGHNGIYPPILLALKSNTVVVVAQYRLGLYGSLYVPGTKIRGNQQLQDQRMALEWVQRNIANFEGDPTKVTIMGQSAGGFSVISHMVSKPSFVQGLFHRVISLSTGLTIPFQTPQSHVVWNGIISQVSGCTFGTPNPEICFEIGKVKVPNAKNKFVKVIVRPAGVPSGSSSSGTIPHGERAMTTWKKTDSTTGVVVFDEEICLTQGSSYKVKIDKKHSSSSSGESLVSTVVTINACMLSKKKKYFLGPSRVWMSYRLKDSAGEQFLNCLEGKTPTELEMIVSAAQNARGIQVLTAVLFAPGTATVGDLISANMLATPTVDACQGPLEHQLTDAVQLGLFDSSIPLMIGSCLNDGHTYAPEPVRDLVPPFYNIVMLGVGIPAPLLALPRYECVSPSTDCSVQVEQLITDLVFRCPNWEHARLYNTLKGVTDRAWNFRWKEVPHSDHWGCGNDTDPDAVVCHACDIPYIWSWDRFHIAGFTFDTDDVMLSSNIQTFIGTFAETGYPGVADGVLWQAVNGPGNDYCAKMEAPFSLYSEGSEEDDCLIWIQTPIPSIFLSNP